MKDHPAAASGAKREKLHVLPYDLVPFQEMTDAYVRVAEFGAKKYEPWNWSKGLSRVQILGSLLRHTFAYLRGEETDKDSGLSHTDHIIWNAVALGHNVRWNLEDGRRVEPPRAYKLPPVEDDATYLDHVNADGSLTKVRIDPDEPIVDQVREIVSDADARIDDRDALAAYIRLRRANGKLKKASVVRVFKEFGLDKISDACPDQIRQLFAAIQAVERDDQ